MLVVLSERRSLMSIALVDHDDMENQLGKATDAGKIPHVRYEPLCHRQAL
jgi:hypothetical protein